MLVGKVKGLMSKLDDMIKKKEEPELKVVVCPRCKTINLVDAKFCNSCGNSFSDELTKADKEEELQKIKKRVKWRKKEEHIIDNKEYDTTNKTQSFVLLFAAIGLFGLFYLYYINVNDIVVPIVMMVGMMMFLPIGMILGWYLLDPYMRCKMLRRTTRRNWGIVNFIGRGNKIVSRIKNFDDSLIWIGDKMWVLTKGYIYQITKNSNAIVDKKVIEPDSVVTLIDTVPCVFVDLDSMTPRRISTEDREPVDPMEIASVMKAWVDNERKKMLETKKRTDLLLLIACIGAVAGAVIAVMVLITMNEMQTQITTLRNTISSLAPPM